MRNSIKKQLTEAQKVIGLLQDELKRTNSELLQMTLEMDDRVANRTSEMMNVNQALRKEIRDHKRTAKALKEANKKLKELDQLKSDFLSMVSHELRTPISIICEGVSLCLEGEIGELNDTQRKFLTATKNNIERLTRLINDLLDISKIEAGKLKLRRVSVDLCEVMQKIYDHFEHHAREKGIKLVVESPQTDFPLYIDEDKVVQIFHNLLSNAVRYTGIGGLVTAQIFDQKNFVECRVVDTGIGIAQKNIPKLFSKFEQLERIDGPGYKGTGLGLAITKELVEMHGGNIHVQSEPGKGSTFVFTLKKVPFPKILVVDDDVNIIEIVHKFLEIEHYGLDQALSGKEAITKAQKGVYQLIILDMKMPKMSGYEVIGRLKHDVRTHDIPILVMSAYSVDSQLIKPLNKHSVFPIIRKPFKSDELRIKVRSLICN